VRAGASNRLQRRQLGGLTVAVPYRPPGGSATPVVAPLRSATARLSAVTVAGCAEPTGGPARGWGTGTTLTAYLKRIDDIEAATGLDFFPDLDDEEEDALEAKTFTTMWGND
jgi:hypothetical protein